MRRLSRLTEKKTLPILLVAIALVSATSFVLVSRSQSYQACYPQSGSVLSATATATATGTLSVLWGDPYLAPVISQGTGNETFSVQGGVTPRSDLAGAYVYNQPCTTGDLEAQWNTPTETYSIDVYFYQGHSPYNRTTIFPWANSFAAMYIYFKGELTINGAASTVKGYAGLVAAAPDYFSFHGTARATYIVLYAQTYHGNQYIFRWSQTDQIINGLEQPRSDSILQNVTLT